jgi:hypothetical protein
MPSTPGHKPEVTSEEWSRINQTIDQTARRRLCAVLERVVKELPGGAESVDKAVQDVRNGSNK